MSEPHEDEPGEPVPDAEPESEQEPTDEETEHEEAEHVANTVESLELRERGDDDEDEQPGTQAQAKAQRDEQKAVEKMFTAFENETQRHTKRVAEIAGDSAPDLLQCPMCAPDEGQPNITGWLLPVKPSEEKIANVRQAIGLAPKIDYREDPHSKVCPSCGGLKSVVPAGAEATGLLLACADCGAQGWQATDAVRGGVPVNGEVPTPLAVVSGGPPSLEPDSPEIAALKAQGYTVIAPYSAGS